jgi:hypothetical protein
MYSGKIIQNRILEYPDGFILGGYKFSLHSFRLIVVLFNSLIKGNYNQK